MLKSHLETLQGLTNCVGEIEGITRAITTAYRNGKKLILAGNGGSAADALHIAGELAGRFAYKRPALPAIAVNANTSTLTAVANDFDFDHIFSREIEALCNEGDVVILLSTSGSSPNILLAAYAARKAKAVIIGFTRTGPNKLKELSDICLTAPGEKAYEIQESHEIAYHIICELVEKELFPHPDE